MITINDNDLSITVAQKIICGVKPVSPLKNALCNSNKQDMFELEEIKEIADY